MARILYEILSGVVLNLIYMSIYSDGLKLTPVTFNPIVGEPFELECDTEVTIIKTVAITAPDNIIAGSCSPFLSPFPAGCSNTVNYNTSWNEEAHTVTIKTSNLSSNYNGTWKCTHNAVTGTYNLVNKEIEDESFTLFPMSFTDNITSETTSISFSATYGCTNFKVFFKWFVVDSASNKFDISGTHNVVENSSECTSSGFNGYTETKEVNWDVYSSDFVQGLVGSYMLGVEVHYMDEVVTLHSMKYFGTYFVFNPSTTTAPSTEATAPVNTNNGSSANWKYIGIGLGIFALIVIIIISIIYYRNKRGNKRDDVKTPKRDNSNKTGEPTVNKSDTPANTAMQSSKPWETTVNKPDTPENMAMQSSKPWDNAVNTPGNPGLAYIQNDHHVDYDRRYNSGNPEHMSMPNEYHVDYDRRKYSGNPEHEPQPSLPPADYDRRNYSGNPEPEPLPSLPPADYDRRNGHDSHF